MSEEISAKELSENLIPAVEEQLQSPDTAFVKEHFNRLLFDGMSSKEIKMMIALCLADEIELMQEETRAFDLSRYEQMLETLPELPE